MLLTRTGPNQEPESACQQAGPSGDGGQSIASLRKCKIAEEDRDSQVMDYPASAIQARGLTSALPYPRHAGGRLALHAGILLIAASVFIPGHLGGWLVERIFIAGSFAIATFLVLEANLLGRRVFGFIPPGAVLAHALALEIVYLLATLINQLVEPLPFNPLELGRYPAIASVVLLLGAIAGPELTRAVGRIYRLSLVYTATVTAALLWKPPIISGIVEALYQDTKTTVVLPVKVRISIPFENPNYFAFYLVGVVIYLLYLDKARSRHAYVLGASVLMLLTGSKAGWLALSLLVALWLCRGLWTPLSIRTGPNLAAGMTLVTLAVMVIVGVGLFDRIVGDTSRVESTIASYEVGQLLSEPTIASRIQLVTLSIETFKRSPLVGWGSVEHRELQVFDNQYALWLVRLGLIGSAIVLSLFGRLIWAVVKRTSGQARFGITSYMVCVLALLGTATFLENFRLLVQFVAVLALFAGASIGARRASRG
jgi:O-antigen ligase